MDRKCVILDFARLPQNAKETRQASQVAILTEDALEDFDVGNVRLRATATGRPQWTRLPPPVVEEIAVEIQNN